jgi:hypothetical protein
MRTIYAGPTFEFKFGDPQTGPTFFELKHWDPYSFFNFKHWFLLHGLIFQTCSTKFKFLLSCTPAFQTYSTKFKFLLSYTPAFQTCSTKFLISWSSQSQFRGILFRSPGTQQERNSFSRSSIAVYSFLQNITRGWRRWTLPPARFTRGRRRWAVYIYLFYIQPRIER